VKLKNVLRGLVALMLAIAAIPTGTEAQDRDRERRRDPTVSVPNIFVQSASRARLGLYVDARQSRRYDEQGARIRDVMHRSPAEDAGLREGDIVTALDGQALAEPLADAELEAELDRDESLPAQRLLALARAIEPGQSVEIRYLREGDTRSVEIVAEEFDFPRVMAFGDEGAQWTFDLDEDRIEEWSRRLAERMKDLLGRGAQLRDFSNSYAIFGGDCPGSGNSWAVDAGGCVGGVELRALNPTLGEYFQADRGVLVIDVDEESTLGLLPGDVIVAVGDREVETVDRARSLIGSYEEDEPIRMTIVRKGVEQVVEGSLSR